jgi:anti-sigma regulatory factor (Ser/Thr protein kinase)
MPAKADHPDQPHIRLEMLSQARFLSAARAMVHQFAQRLGFAESECCQISLAVDEALCNVINHGYERRDDGHIWMNFWALDRDGRPGLRIVIEDRARQVDPATIKSRNLDDIRPGGLGVHIIREIMDHVHYEQREDGGMRLTMSKRLTSHTASGAPASEDGMRATQASGANIKERA